MKPTQLTTPISIEEFDYCLPDERIAKFPLTRRDASKLLVYKNNTIVQTCFADIADFLAENSLLVYNNTRVIQARLIFRKDTGARIEVFCLDPLSPSDYAQSLGANGKCVWNCMVGNLKKWKDCDLSKTIQIGDRNCVLKVKLLSSHGNTHVVEFTWDNEDVHFADILENAGELPIPPYLHRETQESDLTTYQTVYSKIKGSVAAPTAGLHFTPEVFKSLKIKNIELEELTLHVGAGTFQPIKTLDISEHVMHTEVISVKRTTIKHIQERLGSIIAVGTTSVRTLESLYYLSVGLRDKNVLQNDKKLKVTQWQPYELEYTLSAYDALQNLLDYLDENQLSTLHAETQIMIKPGYKFKIVEAMITNFHQPKSTLLLLVSAFVKGDWKMMYDYALENEFRFLSYGDSSLLFKSL